MPVPPPIGSIKIISLLVLLAFLATGCNEPNDSRGRVDLALNPVLKVEARNGLIVPVTISGQRYKFLLATGSNFTILDQRLAGHLVSQMTPGEIPEIYREGISTIRDTLGGDRLGVAHPLPLQIGKQTVLGSDPWLTLDLSAYGALTGVQIDGLLGMDIFRRFNWIVDNLQQTLLIAQSTPSLSDYDHCSGYSDSHGNSPTLWFDYSGHPVPLQLNTLLEENSLPEQTVEKFRSLGGRVRDLAIEGWMAVPENLNLWADFWVDGLAMDDWPVGEMLFARATDDEHGVGMNFLARFDRYALLPSKMLFCFNARATAQRL
ncbi:retropepsin-like domain-containing protein [Pseudomonas mosselii]|uniref:retropepsin-like aspartic protease n=1 Tax=Pseudomonas mosselii TaxID=78327 RepID=UPI002DBC970B|nr:retropepsin-like aspartic protease [Pseudomonas mosselii]MEB5932410.1 retropepsin-like domain-containing protein [Pseudomonas mosselii]